MRWNVLAAFLLLLTVATVHAKQSIDNPAITSAKDALQMIKK